MFSIIYSFLVDTSIALPEYHKISIMLDGMDCSSHCQGIDVVIYDSDFGQIIDKVNINMIGDEMTLIHY